MTGRDIIKFIVYNHLLDKNIVSEDGECIEFIDYFSDDIEYHYKLFADGSIVIEHIEQYPNTVITVEESIDLSDIQLSNLKQLDSSTQYSATASALNQFSSTYRQWMKQLEDEGSFTHVICEYADNDFNFGKNCKTFNQLLSYLETRGASKDVLDSAELTWTQYMRECRLVEE